MDNSNKQEKCRNLALRGYRKLAFGDTSDVFRILGNTEITENERRKMNFFNVSEIKKNKDSIEIKFFDRLKALKEIELLVDRESDELPPFYKVLEESAKHIIGKNKGVED